MRILITAGPTREPIDPVRFLSNHSSGQLGACLVSAAIEAGHTVTAITGPISVAIAAEARRLNVETTRQMFDAVLSEFPHHDLLIMSAAVADYRPKQVSPSKIGCGGTLTLELEATEDIVASAAKIRTACQRIVGFALEQGTGLDRARHKLVRKNLDMIVFNPLETMNSASIQATLLYPDAPQEALPPLTKQSFAHVLLDRCLILFAPPLK